MRGRALLTLALTLDHSSATVLGHRFARIRRQIVASVGDGDDDAVRQRLAVDLCEVEVIVAIFTITDNGRLRGHAGASLGAINEMLKRRSVAEWLRRGQSVEHRGRRLYRSRHNCSKEFGTRSRRFIFSTL